MSDRDLIAEGQAQLDALETDPNGSAAFTLSEWAGLNLAEILRRWESDARDLHAVAVVLDGIITQLGVEDDEAVLQHIRQLQARSAELDTVAIEALAAYRRIAELEQDVREEGNRVGRLQDQLRAACAEGADALARVAELEAAQRPPLGRIEDALIEAWDDGNATGLDGWTGPGRGSAEVDSQAVYNRDRVVRKVLDELNETPATPPGFVVGCLDRVTDLFEKWAEEESEHRAAGEHGIAEGLHVAIEELREAIHGEVREVQP